MLSLLMDGQAQTATELALEGGVTPSTASSHLTRLTKAKILEIVRQGRHRYFRIATPEVAAAIEALMGVASSTLEKSPRHGPSAFALRNARVCYDHLAGTVAVHFLERVRGAELIFGHDDAMTLTAKGEAWCQLLGVDLAALTKTRRRLCRGCIDWSERRTHLAGALGAALLGRWLDLRYVRREIGTRAITITRLGEAFFDRPLEPRRP